MLPTERLAYTPAEAGAALGVSGATIRRMVAAGELGAVTVWGRLRITRTALDAYLSERERAAQAPRMLRTVGVRSRQQGGA